MIAASEPVFNVPKVVTAVLAVLVLVHAVRELVLSRVTDIEFLLLFSFIPARYETALISYPGGIGAELWTFVTYALIHSDLSHLGFNSVWLLPFGTAVARRFGATRFLAFFALTAAAGAVVHLATHTGERVPVVGASAAISGFMAASMRFAFQRGGPLGMLRERDALAYRVPAVPLFAALRDPRILAFLAAWFGLNLLFGLGSFTLAGSEATIAWEAHIGGFVAGLIAFALFDPVAKIANAEGGNGPDAEATPP